MRHLGKFIALTAVALAFAGTTAAQANPGVNANLVDGNITVSDISCTWTNASYTGGPPPSSVTIDRGTVNPPGGNMTCTGASATLDNNPTVSFDDANGKATVDSVVVTGNRIGVYCTYTATNVMLMRDGTSRRYTGTFTAARTAGSIFFCPSSHSGSADITFH